MKGTTMHHRTLTILSLAGALVLGALACDMESTPGPGDSPAGRAASGDPGACDYYSTQLEDPNTFCYEGRVVACSYGFENCSGTEGCECQVDVTAEQMQSGVRPGRCEAGRCVPKAGELCDPSRVGSCQAGAIQSFNTWWCNGTGGGSPTCDVCPEGLRNCDGIGFRISPPGGTGCECAGECGANGSCVASPSS